MGKILLVKRGNEPNKNKWTIPGGLVKVGESLTEALKREIREEVGLEIEVGDVACVSEEIIEDDKGIRYRYVIIDLFARVKGGNLRAIGQPLLHRNRYPQEVLVCGNR